MMASDYSQYGGVLVARQDKVLTITLNSRETLNAFTGPMHTSMSRIWDDVNDDPDVHVVVLTGAGRAFSAGGNVIAHAEKDRRSRGVGGRYARGEADRVPHDGMRQADHRAGQRPCGGTRRDSCAALRHHYRG